MKHYNVSVNGHGFHVEAGSRHVAIKKCVKKYMETFDRHHDNDFRIYVHESQAKKWGVE